MATVTVTGEDSQIKLNMNKNLHHDLDNNSKRTIGRIGLGGGMNHPPFQVLAFKFKF